MVSCPIGNIQNFDRIHKTWTMLLFTIQWWWYSDLGGAWRGLADSMWLCWNAGTPEYDDIAVPTSTPRPLRLAPPCSRPSLTHSPFSVVSFSQLIQSHLNRLTHSINTSYVAEGLGRILFWKDFLVFKARWALATRNMFGRGGPASQARTTRNWRTQRLRTLVKIPELGRWKKIPQHILVTWVTWVNIGQSVSFTSIGHRMWQNNKEPKDPRLGQILGATVRQRESEEGQIVARATQARSRVVTLGQHRTGAHWSHSGLHRDEHSEENGTQIQVVQVWIIYLVL